MVPFLLIELIFLGANLLKVSRAAGCRSLIGAVIMVVMLTWRRGSRHPRRQDAARTRCRSTA